ncbi:hypothetical protein [Candidatus Palauibacter sp.]|uniref:hypothetical protein n=1 Tax=Candidatus Palauibacter sp. TaxID=3101350 RepID=UPI003B010C8A
MREYPSAAHTSVTVNVDRLDSGPFWAAAAGTPSAKPASGIATEAIPLQSRLIMTATLPATLFPAFSSRYASHSSFLEVRRPALHDFPHAKEVGRALGGAKPEKPGNDDGRSTHAP